MFSVSVVDLWKMFQEMESSGDPRTQDFVGVRTPWLMLTTIAGYLLLIYWIIPAFMKNRQPFNLKAVLIIYNFTLSAGSAWHFVMLGLYGWFGKYDYRCVPQDLSTTPPVMMMVNLSWLYWVSKFVELLDTIFFALRKKRNQISFLHVFHHASMVFSVWLSVKYMSVGHAQFIAFTNTFVHTIMYFYYGMAAIGPHMRKYLWWKKYITIIQLIQLLMNLGHGLRMHLTNCDFPTWLINVTLVQSGMYLILFINFYNHEYLKRSLAKTDRNTNKYPMTIGCIPDEENDKLINPLKKSKFA